MYIAFKWLTALALAMWLAMCIIDIYVKNSKETRKKGFSVETWTFKNISVPSEDDSETFEAAHFKKNYPQYYDPAILHYAMFFAGAIAVSVFNKKREIMSYTKTTIAKIDVSAAAKMISVSLKKTVSISLFAMFKYSSNLWVILKTIVTRFKNINGKIKDSVLEKSKKQNLFLLNQLKEITEERRKLGQLLIAAIHENKNIRTQFQLENMAKNRLVQHIEDTQKKIKENRSKYVSFQHLYLVTHQENLFLKDRIRKLTKEKENAEKDLMDIINEVYQSKNSALKSFCSRFMVRPKDNLLNNDLNAEVQKFIERSRFSSMATTSLQITNAIDGEEVVARSSKTVVTDILQDDDSLVPLVSCAPKLKGLPGECIWTVKDKDGIIEKLYEYDYESDFDNGDTIRRIRQYSVYYDKDCLLDFSRSRTIITENFPLKKLHPTRERFLTGSAAFQKFLQNNKHIVSSSGTTAPPPLC